jgi:hypothetical protein
MLLTFLAATALIFHLAMGVILVRRYMSTREVGFIWLGVAVVIWPLVSRLLDVGERVLISRTVNHPGATLFPFSLVGRGEVTIGELAASLAVFEQLIGICLLMVAVLYLSKGRNTNGFRPAA